MILLRHTALWLAVFVAPVAAEQPVPLAPAPADPAIAAALAQVSPVALRSTVAKLVSFGNRNTLSSEEANLAPGTGIGAAADWIFAEFTRISADCGRCLEVRRDHFIEPGVANTRIPKNTRIENIYAILPGTDAAQTARRVLVTGHYDSRNSDTFDARTPAPGANDDASGTAVSIECARVLSKMRFPSTIVFVAVAGEEQGLNGSRHLARLARSEGWQLEAVLNNDIVGGDTTAGDTLQDKTAVRVFSEGVPGPATLDQLRQIQTLGAENDSPSRELARALEEIAATYLTPSSRGPVGAAGQTHSDLRRSVLPFHPVLIARRDRFLRGGDHSSFNLEGFAAVRLTEFRENFSHQHQNVRVEDGVRFGDLIEYDDFDYMANVARLNAAALASFASAPGEPRAVGVVTTSLDNNTTLKWQAPLGMPAGASFEVLLRPTDAPQWTQVVAVGSATSITLPISKDNTIFGVRSVDPAGHRSPAVYPLPIRNDRSGSAKPSVDRE